MTEIEQVQAMLTRVRRLAHKRRWRLRWGCLVEPDVLRDGDTGEVLDVWRLTTIGGKRLILTNEMVVAVAMTHLWLQGTTPALLATDDLFGDERDPAQDLVLTLYHSPMPGKRGEPLSRVTHAKVRRGASALILMAPQRPAGWPP